MTARSVMGSWPAAHSPALLRALAGDTTFSIISNNCWGAHIYQRMELPYSTPFVGLFIPPDSYLRLLKDFDRLIGSDLRFLKESGLPALNERRRSEEDTYPIALLGEEVEIHFLHYASEGEARDKWTRRVGRIAADPVRRFYKFDDREGASDQHIASFSCLPMANRLCFTARPHAVSTVVAPPEGGGLEVIDGLALSVISRRYFNTLRWISRRPRWLPLPSLV